MFESNTSFRRSRGIVPAPGGLRPEDHRQRKLMMSALVLLVVALGLLLYRDRDFWFPDTDEADDQPFENVTAADNPPAAEPGIPQKAVTVAAAKSHRSAKQNREAIADVPTEAFMPVQIGERTVLPPLEVEVVAGDAHRTVRPGSNEVHVELQPDSPSEQADAAPAEANASAPVANNAAERVEMSAETADLVTESVRPGYPMLARQMKVQGSVVLQAFIGRDGLIQDLRVLGGPPILASAAREAVKQWHFKPHFEGPDAVETQAKITVNFTISTN